MIGHHPTPGSPEVIALIEAASKGDLKEVNRLLDQKVPIDHVWGETGPTALMQAVSYRQPEIIRLLLERKADIDAIRFKGVTALMVAVESWGEQMVKLLLEYGPTISKKSEWGESALSKAIAFKRKGIIEALKTKLLNPAYEKEIELFFSGSSQCLYLPKELVQLIKGYRESVSASDQLNQLNSKEAKVEIELIEAVSKGDVKAVTNILKTEVVLLDYVYKKNEADIGVTALAVAASQKNFEMVTLLLEHKASVSVGQPRNELLQFINGPRESVRLIEAVSKSDVETVTKILKTEVALLDYVSTQSTTHIGVTALTEAAFQGNLMMVDLLVDHKASVDQPIKNNDSPLIISVRYGRTKIVEFLLNKKAEINFAGGNKNNPLIVAVCNNNLEMVKLLLRHKANINQEDICKGTALMHAALEGNLEIVNVLLNAKADLTITDTSNQTALSYATLYHHWEVVKLLKKYNQEHKNRAASILDGSSISQSLLDIPQLPDKKSLQLDSDSKRETPESLSELETFNSRYKTSLKKGVGEGFFNRSNLQVNDDRLGQIINIQDALTLRLFGTKLNRFLNILVGRAVQREVYKLNSKK